MWRENHLKYSLLVNRQKLFKCFEPLGNLAEKTGGLTISVEAESKERLDPNWLKNAVEEPIEEAGIEIKKPSEN